jgi:hypothetical protein
MTVRLRSTITVEVLATSFESFRRAVHRSVPVEHNWQPFEVSYVSVIGKRSGATSTVRVIVDTLAEADDSEDVRAAAVEATVRALILAKESNRDYTADVEVVA